MIWPGVFLVQLIMSRDPDLEFGEQRMSKTIERLKKVESKGKEENKEEEEIELYPQTVAYSPSQLLSNFDKFRLHIT